MSTVDILASCIKDIPEVIKAKALPTAHPAVWHLTFTVKEDTTKLRGILAEAIYYLSAEVTTLGEMNGVAETPTGVRYLTNFDIEVLTYDTWLEELEEGSSCFDSECNGTMEFDWSECSCGTPHSIGPCSNCADGLNLVCAECNCNVEELEEENKMEKSFTSAEVKSRVSDVTYSAPLDSAYKPWNEGDYFSGEWITDSSKNDQIKTQKEQQNMTKLNRKQVTVTLIDNDSSLPAASAIVFEKKLISDGSREDIIQEVILQGKVKEALDRHNEIRSGIINLGILERVGNEVMLRAVELKDLDWTIV